MSVLKQEMVVLVTIFNVNSTTTYNDNNRMLAVPNFILSNVMSLSPKIDEIRLAVNKIASEIAVFTETWLS